MIHIWHFENWFRIKERICQTVKVTGAPCGLIHFDNYVAFHLCMHRLSPSHLSRFFLLYIYQFHPGPLNHSFCYPLFLYPLLIRTFTLGGASTVMKRGRVLPRDKKRRLEMAGEKPEVELNEHLCQLGRNRSADGPGGWTKQVGHTVGILETAS